MRRAEVVILVLVVVGGGGATAWAGGVPLEKASDPTFLVPLAQKFRTFQLEAWDRDALLTQAAEGTLTLRLFAKDYVLLLPDKHILRDGGSPMLLDPVGESTPDPSYDFTAVTFRGTVQGSIGSAALVTFTKAGLDGYVKTAGEWIQFEPSALVVRGAPYELQVIYRTVDLVPMEHGLHGTGIGISPPPADEPTGIGVASWAGDIPVKATGDYSFYQAYSDCWHCRIDTVMARVRDMYSGSFAWTLNHVISETCTSTACDQNTGRTSTNAITLLNGFADWEYNNKRTQGWQMVQLFTGKILDNGAVGWAADGGQYGLSTMVNNDDLDAYSSVFEAAANSAHELGHNLKGQHDFADWTKHDHYYSNGIWAGSFNHYTLMRTPFCHEPSEWKECVEAFSDTNRDYMNQCKNNEFATWGWIPGDYYCGFR